MLKLSPFISLFYIFKVGNFLSFFLLFYYFIRFLHTISLVRWALSHCTKRSQTLLFNFNIKLNFQLRKLYQNIVCLTYNYSMAAYNTLHTLFLNVFGTVRIRFTNAVIKCCHTKFFSLQYRVRAIASNPNVVCLLFKRCGTKGYAV